MPTTRSHRSFLAAFVLLAPVAIRDAAANVNYREGASGDLSSNLNLPSPVGTIGVGSNTVRGVVIPGSPNYDAYDAFSFVVPVGMRITQSQLAYTGFGGERTYVRSFSDGTYTWFTSPGTHALGPVPLNAGVHNLAIYTQATVEGDYTFTFTAELLPPPANDVCASAVDVFNNTSTPFNTINAGNEGITAGCGPAGPAGDRDIWFRQPGACPTTVWYSVCDADFDVQLGLYTGFCGALVPAGCSDSATCGSATGALVARRGSPSQWVYIRVAGASGDLQGTGTLRVKCCGADFNATGTITVQDIFDFLAAYFANSTLADFNFSGSITVQDIFDFLAAYFAGCP